MKVIVLMLMLQCREQLFFLLLSVWSLLHRRGSERGYWYGFRG